MGILININVRVTYPGVILPSTSYCQNQEDVDKLVRGTKLCLRIVQTEPLASHLDWTERRSDLDHELHLKTDAELEAVVRERVETVYHPASTCRMAPLEDDGVVDGNLRVYGIANLRVCDASIFPSMVSGHTVGLSILVLGSPLLSLTSLVGIDRSLHRCRGEIVGSTQEGSRLEVMSLSKKQFINGSVVYESLDVHFCE
jgi:hypothetical protein